MTVRWSEFIECIKEGDSYNFLNHPPIPAVNACFLTSADSGFCTLPSPAMCPPMSW